MAAVVPSPPPAVRPLTAAPRGLSAWQEHRLRCRLRRSVPTEPWVDAQVATQAFTGGDGEPVVARYHDARAFPPGGVRRTRMRWCRACGRWTPPQALSLIEHPAARGGPAVWATLVCDDCRHDDDDGRFAELYAAGLHLRPAGSRTVVGLRGLIGDRQRGE